MMIATLKRLLRTTWLVGCFGLYCLALPASAGTISITNSTPGIFDASIGNRAVTISGFEAGFGTGVITDVNVTINYLKADGELVTLPANLVQPFFNEIHFAIIAPNGKVVELIAAESFQIGADGALFDGTQTFDQSAATIVNANTAQPTAGTFRPTGPGSLNDFNGDSALGQWTLFIEDTISEDALRFRSFTLNVTTDFTVPEPASLWLLGLAMIGFAWRRKSQD